MLWVSIFAGLALTTAFAPFSFFPSAFIAIALMLRVWRDASFAEARLSGYLFGLAYWGSSIYWIYYSLHDFGNAPAAFAIFSTVLLVALLALYFMLLGWAVAHGARLIHPMAFNLGVYPALWVSLEWLRSTLLTGFPWNLVGQSLIDSPFAQTLVWGGTLGASWLVVFIAGALNCGFRKECRKASAVIYFLAGSLLLLVWSSQKMEWTQASGPEIKASVVQGGTPQELKFDAEVFAKIIVSYRRLTGEVADSDLVVWPETAIPAGYDQIDEQLLLPMHRLIAESGGGDFITGVFFNDGGNDYNSLVKVAQPPIVYHKRHLVPFGEYIPLRWLIEIFRNYVIIPMSDLSAGTQSSLLPVGRYRVAASVCYESIFGGALIEESSQADYLVNISNDSWFGDSIARHQHLQMARLRAIESGRAMVRATSTGISAMIDHNGDVVAQIEDSEPNVLTAFIQPRQGMTPYARWRTWAGSRWVIALLALSLLIICFIISGKFRASRNVSCR